MRPSPPDTTTALRFALSIDGDEIGRFEVLMAATPPHIVPRPIQPQELPLIFEHASELRSGKVSLTDHSFEVPAKGSTRAARAAVTLVLKRGRARQVALRRWQNLANAGVASRVVLTHLDATGRALAQYDLGIARPAKITGPTLDAQGGDVAIEEIVIDHEGLRLEPPPADRQRKEVDP